MLGRSVASLVLATALLIASGTEAVHSHGQQSVFRRHVKAKGRRISLYASRALQARGGSEFSGIFSGRATNYAPGLGACGGYNTPSEYVVALNSAQFGQEWCGKQISIWANGQSATAQVVDECPGCPDEALDMSPALFSQFAPISQGLFQMNWQVVDANAQTSSSSSNQSSSKNTNTSSSPTSISSSSTSATSNTGTPYINAADTSTMASGAPMVISTGSDSNLAGLGQIVNGFVQLAQEGHQG
ncbi:hypothetical protein K437DRAFT_224974 [Tilletiaria anomala UBC 951]|uniref:Uncharacterized protein n=1 Tax=Tilletiaria anomala (strain ATCC 24038 / CBS 436.72 / UBC 951) TaxID=1037660 RepID=A0A066VRP0_TILAU|nr:uncharacterized protein K437DRAFT_224974 [Tilletiaria anomala UBC 951]KDN44367.1 hypothetical protein K437DRAFT_224974 [Tilletiaria anomala UBC 951]